MTRAVPLPCGHSPRHPPDPFQQRLLEGQRGAPPLSRLPLHERVRPQFPVRRAILAYPTASPRYRYPCGHAGLPLILHAGLFIRPDQANEAYNLVNAGNSPAWITSSWYRKKCKCS